jgi:hypothetical protein
MKIEIAEHERQMIVLALASLAIKRPSWNQALRKVASDTLLAGDMFDDLVTLQNNPPHVVTSAGDTSNRFMVGGNATGLIQIVALNAALDTQQALNLAAWLSIVADPSGEEFGRLVAEIKK